MSTAPITTAVATIAGSKAMKRLLLVLLFWGLSGALHPERPEILDRIRDYDMRHSDLLVRIVKDPETLRYAKVRALEKMAIIYQQSGKQGEQVAYRYLTGIGTGLAHKSPDVREAACSAVGVFAESAVAPQLASVAAKVLQEELHPEVIATCARSLQAFTKEAATIVPALLSQLDRYLAELRDSSADERALREICHTLKAMKQRKSFIPLLKLLQSRYGESVKREAQEAIQAIRVE